MLGLQEISRLQDTTRQRTGTVKFFNKSQKQHGLRLELPSLGCADITGGIRGVDSFSVS